MAKADKSKTSATKPPAKSREQRQAEKQALAMWALLGNGGEGLGGAMKPPIEKSEREALRQAGLIAVEKRARGAFWLEVTDRGWRWAEEHLGDPLPDKTFAGAFVLRTWLARLQAFMQARDIGLADVLGPQPNERATRPVGPSDAHESTDYAALRERIRRAYLDVTDGSFNQRALLSDIRAKLTDIDRNMLDRALERMHFEDGATLMGLDNPREVTPAVRDAELSFHGEPMHILWITK
jgi:hypothetical protein